MLWSKWINIGCIIFYQKEDAMKPNRRRAFIRSGAQTSIMFAPFNTSNFHHGVMKNNSVGGMYFESDRILSPGTDIYIKILDFQPDPYWPEYTSAYRAEVVWCRPMSNGNDPKYGIGVRFMVNSCDQCGELIPYDEIHKVHDHMILCSECSLQLNLLTGTMRNSMEQYLTGNVV